MKTKALAVNLGGVLTDVAKLRNKKLAAILGGLIALVVSNALGVNLTADEAAGILVAIGLVAEVLTRKPVPKK